jgi:hypothetical protein
MWNLKKIQTAALIHLINSSIKYLGNIPSLISLSATKKENLIARRRRAPLPLY